MHISAKVNLSIYFFYDLVYKLIMYQQYSPNMLKTFEECPRKFDFRYIQGIQMPVNDEIFEFGKNIHALASYYLRKENIDKMEKSLTDKESKVWNYLKSSKYFSYDVINTEYNLAVRVGKHFFGGRLDALVKNGEQYYILDYKTGSAPKNAKYDYQTMIYALCVHEFFKTDNVIFVYIDLRHKEEVCIKLTESLVSEYKSKLQQISEKIDTFEHAPKKQSCIDELNNCEFSIICY